MHTCARQGTGLVSLRTINTILYESIKIDYRALIDTLRTSDNEEPTYKV